MTRSITLHPLIHSSIIQLLVVQIADPVFSLSRRMSFGLIPDRPSAVLLQIRVFNENQWAAADAMSDDR